MLRLAAIAALLSIATGCAGDYVARTRGVRAAYEQQDYPRALGELKALDRDGSEKDRLLVLLDRGMVLHSAGKWAESIAVLAEADRLAAQLDAVSVTEEAGAFLSNERQRAYRGEDFERLMISVLQALNYLELGQDEGALVEVRRVNERLRKMVAEEKKPYSQLAIARYLGGVIYEDQREWDSAFIDYAKALELAPGLDASLAEPVLRLAKKTGRDDAYRELSQKYPGLAVEALGPGEGQVVVVVEAGRSPEKESSDRNDNQLGIVKVPVYRDRGSVPFVQVTLGGQTRRALEVTSLARVAQVHLQDRVGRMLLKQVAGAAVKAGVAATAGAVTNSRELGLLAFFLLNLGNAADLRSWLSLPAEFQLARFRVPAGVHSLRVGSLERTVEVKPGRIAVVVTRQH